MISSDNEERSNKPSWRFTIGAALLHTIFLAPIAWLLWQNFFGEASSIQETVRLTVLIFIGLVTGVRILHAFPLSAGLHWIWFILAAAIVALIFSASTLALPYLFASWQLTSLWPSIAFSFTVAFIAANLIWLMGKIT
ncbi:hypothetical protein [Gimibacter soli]|uniref:Uncharacterized protein n=1 Tax=Gimibacter soli TaxID=3024400 RepID=A0AAE9XPK6_9PROT|nr:hypothetical protein [Gimibacter soli]WCL52716.1 hypothetical protein PH603_09210 [Gimibacter soli]